MDYSEGCCSGFKCLGVFLFSLLLIPSLLHCGPRARCVISILLKAVEINFMAKDVFYPGVLPILLWALEKCVNVFCFRRPERLIRSYWFTVLLGSFLSS